VQFRSPNILYGSKNDHCFADQKLKIWKLSNQLLEWADAVFVMEHHHKESILKRFDSSAIEEKQINVLDIPDRYRYMDPALIEILKEKVKANLSMTDFP